MAMISAPLVPNSTPTPTSASIPTASGVPSLQTTISQAFLGPLNQFDPGWEAQARQSGMTAEQINNMVGSFATSGNMDEILKSGFGQSQKAGQAIDSLLAGQISKADQSRLSQRSAENAQALGMWGGAVGGAARGLEARDLGMTQYSLQQMGIQLAGHANDALNSATAAVGGLSDLGAKASKNDLGMSLAQGGIGLSTDWLGMNLQMQAANLNAAARYNAGQMASKGADGNLAGAPSGKDPIRIGGPITGLDGKPLQPLQPSQPSQSGQGDGGWGNQASDPSKGYTAEELGNADPNFRPPASDPTEEYTAEELGNADPNFRPPAEDPWYSESSSISDQEYSSFLEGFFNPWYSEESSHPGGADDSWKDVSNFTNYTPDLAANLSDEQLAATSQTEEE